MAGHRRAALDRSKTTGHIDPMAKPNLRDEILTAGLQALHKRGFNATSVQDITEAAGVPKGSFYNHFSSKEELGAAVVGKYVAAGEASRLRLQDRSRRPLARLRNHFEALAAGAENPGAPGCLLGNFGAELSNQSPIIRERVGEAFAKWRGAIAKVILEAREGGELRDGREPEALAAFVLDAWEGAVLRSKVEQSRAPLDAFLEMVFSTILA